MFIIAQVKNYTKTEPDMKASDKFTFNDNFLLVFNYNSFYF
jgi:hypothetical protein